MNLRVVFFGTPNIAAQVLDFLITSNINIVGVVTRIDKPQKRSKDPQPSPVKLVALEHGIPLLQPVKVSDLSFVEDVSQFQADVFVVVAYGAILRKNILEIPRFGCINLHGSLLPKWRGAAPVQRAIMNGDSVSGVTIIQMNEGMDTGDILNIEKIDILPNMTSGELLSKMVIIGAPLLIKTLKEIEEGTTVISKQPAKGTLAPKITKEDCCIDWRRVANHIYNQIRGVSPSPGAWCWIFHHEKDIQKRLLIKSARLDTSYKNLLPGQIIINKNNAIIGCGEGAIQLLTIQLEGKNIVPASNFLNILISKGYAFF